MQKKIPAKVQKDLSKINKNKEQLNVKLKQENNYYANKIVDDIVKDYKGELKNSALNSKVKVDVNMVEPTTSQLVQDI